jgi:hypothetical protein
LLGETLLPKLYFPVAERFWVGKKESTQCLAIKRVAFALIRTFLQIFLGDPNGGHFSSRVAVGEKCREDPDVSGLLLVVEAIQTQMLAPFPNENGHGPLRIERVGSCAYIFIGIVVFIKNEWVLQSIHG